jgi:hypothetical protein
MEIKKRELDEAMTKIYDECNQLRVKFRKDEEGRCLQYEWTREDGDSFLKREAYDKVQKATDDYYVKCLDERTLRIPKNMVVLIGDDEEKECTREEIAALKEKVKTVTSLILKIEKDLDHKEQRASYIQVMKEMFEKYVLPKYPSKIFNESVITGTGGRKERSIRVQYSYDGVNMFYLGRETYCIDDYAWFVDRSVLVNGVTLLDEVKQ